MSQKRNKPQQGLGLCDWPLNPGWHFPHSASRESRVALLQVHVHHTAQDLDSVIRGDAATRVLLPQVCVCQVTRAPHRPRRPHALFGCWSRQSQRGGAGHVCLTQCTLISSRTTYKFLNARHGGSSELCGGDVCQLGPLVCTWLGPRSYILSRTQTNAVFAETQGMLSPRPVDLTSPDRITTHHGPQEMGSELTSQSTHFPRGALTS